MDIIAHRGASGHAPENTLAAFDLAWRSGADGIELDVHLSRDGRIMVHHDPGTVRTSGVDRQIADSDCAELQMLDVGSWRGSEYQGQTLPTLEQVLTGVPRGRQVLIEIKSGPAIAPVLQQVLSSADTAGINIGLISFDADTLLACQQVLPEIPCYWIIDHDEGGADRTPYPSSLIDQVLAYGFAGLDPNYRGIDGHFAAAVRAAGLKLLTWTVNDPAEARRLRALDLTALATDYPDEIRQTLKD